MEKKTAIEKIEMTKEEFEEYLNQMYALGKQHGIESGITLTNFINKLKQPSQKISSKGEEKE